MKYTINTAVLGNTFMLPTDTVDKWLKLASSEQLKVLLCCFRSIAEGINEEDVSNRLNISRAVVEDALAFWAQAGLINGEKEEKKAEQRAVVIKTEMPTRQDVIRRGMEDENVKFILREAQMFFGRNLKQNETSSLLYLYDDCGMDAAVILYLLSHAASCGKCNLSYIEKCAARWLKEGVETVAEAEAMVAKSLREDLAWSFVQKTFGIDKRNPSEKEKDLSDKWVNDWQISRELLKAAYDVCVDTKSKFSFSYIAAVLESWHKKGVKTPDDIEKADKSRQKKTAQNFAGYDLEAVEKMLNGD